MLHYIYFLQIGSVSSVEKQLSTMTINAYWCSMFSTITQMYYWGVLVLIPRWITLWSLKYHYSLVHTQLSDHMTIYTDLIHSLSNWISKCPKIVKKIFRWLIAPIMHAFRKCEKQSKYLLSSLIQEFLVNDSSPTELSSSTRAAQFRLNQ